MKTAWASYSWTDDDLEELGLDYATMPILVCEFTTPSVEEGYRTAQRFEDDFSLDLIEYMPDAPESNPRQKIVKGFPANPLTLLREISWSLK